MNLLLNITGLKWNLLTLKNSLKASKDKKEEVTSLINTIERDIRNIEVQNLDERENLKELRNRVEQKTEELSFLDEVFETKSMNWKIK